MEKTILYLALLLIVVHIFILRVSIMQKRDKSNDRTPDDIRQESVDADATSKTDHESSSQAIP